MDQLSAGDNSGAAIPLAELRAARTRIEPFALRTPLVRLETDSAAEIYLKLENLQPTGSFKIRGAGNAIGSAPARHVAGGVWTASAGNMAQGVAWHARRLGVPCDVVVPDHAPEAKRAAVERLGGRITDLPFADWWQLLVDGRMAGRTGLFVHPVCDRAVMAGNGTIGLEILEDLPDVDTIVVPFGGGGLLCGIASAVRHLRPQTRVLAAEVETSAALAAALAAGEPVDIDYYPSFVDGIGSSRVLDAMWAAVHNLVDGSVVSSLAQVGDGLRLLAERNNVVAEGAAATAVAAALSGRAGTGPIVCVVSGGNIDPSRLAQLVVDPDAGAPKTPHRHRGDPVLTPAMLSDRAEIGDIVAALAYAQSDRDFGSLQALFSDEVTLDLPGPAGGGTKQITVAELVERVRAALTGFAAVLYSTSNVMTYLDGDRARSRVTVHAYHHLPTEPGISDYSLARNNWELDLSRVEGQWLITGWKLGPVAPADGYPGLSKFARSKA